MSVGQRVFISYSKLPRENSEFVRDLARTLRANGFDPWLDEEQIAGGKDFAAEIRSAITGSHHGLFIVTKRWLERDYTRMELSLFARHDPKNHYRVAINREGVDPLEVSAQLQQLHIIEWPVDDPEPESRLWEVYVALTRQRPGPRDEWAEKGRRLIATARRTPVEEEEEDIEVALTRPSWVACAEPPVLAVANDDETILLTDGGRCFRCGKDAGVETLPSVEGWSGAAISPEGTVVVGQYRGMLATLRRSAWDYRSLEASALAVAASPRGVIVGDSASMVTLFASDGVSSASLGKPVVDLCPFDGGVIALAADGTLGRLTWDDGASGFEAIDLPASLDRPVNLFTLPDPSKVGVFSADTVGTLDAGSNRLRAGTTTFPDGIRTIVAVGRKPGYFAVLTDTGRLFHLEATLTASHAVVLPVDPAEVAGIARAGAGGLLAWTVGGTLFAIGRDRTVRQLAAGDVVLASAIGHDAGQILVVRWVKEQGLQVQAIRADGG